MYKRIAVLPGDGIGPEVMKQAERVLIAIAERFNHRFEFLPGYIGGAAYDKYREHFPEKTRALCKEADAILFGAVGGPVSESHLPKWKDCERNSLLQLRKEFSLNINIRPLYLSEDLIELCPLKEAYRRKSIDFVVVRELIGGIYYGNSGRTVNDGIRCAYDVASYNETQIQEVAKYAFDLARTRKGKVVSVDKASSLESSRLWREVVKEISLSYPDVWLEHILVDHCAMKMIQAPWDFDVILTPNLFGDILSEIGASLIGSLGLIPSASLNSTTGFGLYEPAGGSAPSLAGKNTANPTGQILSAAMMLKHSFGMHEECAAIEEAVKLALCNGYRTTDLYTGMEDPVSTQDLTDEILQYVSKESSLYLLY